MGDHVLDRDALEVEDLTAAEDRREHLVLLGGGHDEDGVARGFLEGLEEGVEGARGQHVDLVDDEHLIFTGRGGDVDLLAEGADVVDAVVRGGVELDEVERASLLDGYARFAFAAGLAVGRGVETVDGLGEDTGARGLADAARSAEEVGLGEATGLDRIL